MYAHSSRLNAVFQSFHDRALFAASPRYRTNNSFGDARAATHEATFCYCNNFSADAWTGMADAIPSALVKYVSCFRMRVRECVRLCTSRPCGKILHTLLAVVCDCLFTLVGGRLKRKICGDNLRLYSRHTYTHRLEDVRNCEYVADNTVENSVSRNVCAICEWKLVDFCHSEMWHWLVGVR